MQEISNRQMHLAEWQQIPTARQPIANGCKARLLKSTGFTLSSLVLALFLSSNMAYADYNTAYGENARVDRSFSTAIGYSSFASGR